MLKTRRLGYDGKGQSPITEDTDLSAALARIGGAPSIVEGFIDFTREVSVIAVRSADGADCFSKISIVMNEGRHSTP